jgi:hypothetical protein
MAHGEQWADRVPDPVATDIREHGLVDRVRGLYAEDE